MSNIEDKPYDFEAEFERRLLAFMVRDVEFYLRISFAIRFDHFKNQYCRDICEQSVEYVKKYSQAIPKDILRNQIEKMFYERKRQDATLDDYWDFIDELFAMELTGARYTEDEVLQFAQRQQMRKVLGDAIDRVIAHQDLTPILADVEKALKVGGAQYIDDIILPVEQFLQVPAVPRKTILHPWLKEKSTGMTAGWKGSGKTWFEIMKLDAITRNLTYGPWESTTAVPCLYVDGELNDDELQERLNFIHQGERKAPLYIYNDCLGKTLGYMRASLVNPQWRNRLLDFIVQEKIRYVVFDNLTALTSGASPYDENTKKDWAPIGDWLIDLKHAGCASDLVHHVGYSGHQRGFSGREDAFDTSVLLLKPQNWRPEMGCVFTLQFTKTRVGSNDLHLIQEYNFKLIEVDGKKDWEWTTRKKDELLETLKLFSLGVKQKEIASSLKISSAAITKRKAKLIVKKWMTMKGEVTEAGLEEIKKNSPEDDENLG